MTVEPEHWTFSEDLNPDPMAGWKWINLNWAFKDAMDIIAWHDEACKKDSYWQKNFTSAEIAALFRKKLEWRHEELTKKGNISGTRRLVWWLGGWTMPTIQPYFYEGKLGKPAAVNGDPVDSQKEIL